MALGGRKKPSRRQRKRAGIGRAQARINPDEIVAQAVQRSPEINKPADDTRRPTSPPVAGRSEPLGDLTYVPRDIRRIAMLAVVIFALLGIAAVVLK